MYTFVYEFRWKHDMTNCFVIPIACNTNLSKQYLWILMIFIST